MKLLLTLFPDLAFAVLPKTFVLVNARVTAVHPVSPQAKALVQSVKRSLHTMKLSKYTNKHRSSTQLTLYQTGALGENATASNPPRPPSNRLLTSTLLLPMSIPRPSKLQQWILKHQRAFFQPSRLSSLWSLASVIQLRSRSPLVVRHFPTTTQIHSPSLPRFPRMKKIVRSSPTMRFLSWWHMVLMVLILTGT